MNIQINSKTKEIIIYEATIEELRDFLDQIEAEGFTIKSSVEYATYPTPILYDFPTNPTIKIEPIFGPHNTWTYTISNY